MSSCSGFGDIIEAFLFPLFKESIPEEIEKSSRIQAFKTSTYEEVGIRQISYSVIEVAHIAF